MNIFDLQRRIRELTNDKADGFVITFYSGGDIECTLFAPYDGRDAEDIITEALGCSLEEFAAAAEDELDGKNLYKVDFGYTKRGDHLVNVTYYNDPPYDIPQTLTTKLFPNDEFDIYNSQAKDLFEAVLNR